MKSLASKILAAALLITVILTTLALPASAAPAAPDFSSGNFVDLVPFMKVNLYGKQEDDQDGKRTELTESANGFTAKFNSQATNYGVLFNKDFVKEDGTLYYQCTFDAENDLWDSDIARTYGGPKLILGKAHTDEFSGYLTVLFTREDSIDFRLMDKLGNDLIYIGGRCPALKVNYPNGTAKADNIEYNVIAKLSKKSVSLWVNDVCVIDDVKFDLLYKSGGEKQELVIDSFDAGFAPSATRTTVHNFRLWVEKGDAAGDAAKAPTTTVTSSSNSNTDDKKPATSSKTNTTTDKKPATSSKTNNTTDKNTSSKKPTATTSSKKSDSTASSGTTVEDTSSTTTPTDDMINDLIGEGEEVGTVEGDYVVVKGEKVDHFDWLSTVLVVAGAVLALGAIAAIIVAVVEKKK